MHNSYISMYVFVSTISGLSESRRKVKKPTRYIFRRSNNIFLTVCNTLFLYISYICKTYYIIFLKRKDLKTRLFIIFYKNIYDIIHFKEYDTYDIYPRIHI